AACGARARQSRTAAGRRVAAGPVRGPGRLASLGVLEREGQARARLADLPARGLPRRDDRLVSRAGRFGSGSARVAPAGGAAPGRGGRPPLAARVAIGLVATLYRCTTPTNWLCPCGKVARALHREGILFDEVRVPQRRSRRP